MKNIKSFKKFNEDLDPQVSELFWQSKLLGTLGYLASFGLSYLLFKYMRGESEKKSLEMAKQTSSEVRNSDEMRDVLIKVIGDEKIQSLLSSYKDKIENRTITFNEMKTLSEEMKNLLGDILTVDEWRFCDDVIDTLSKEPGQSKSRLTKNFTNEEKDILQRYGLQEKSDIEFSSTDGKIQIFKNFDDTNLVYYIFQKEMIEYSGNSIFSGPGREVKLKSGQYKDLEKCINASITDDQIIDNLYRMIKEHKTMFRRSRKKDIIDLLDSIKTKEEMHSIITDYREKYNVDLIELFDEIHNSYDDNEFLSSFYKLGLITKTKKYGSHTFDKNY
jgi:hypothetical protein